MKNILITGAAGNLGKTVTGEFLNAAYHVNISVRETMPDSEFQTAYYPDLTHLESVQEMVDTIVSRQGDIHAAIHLVGAYTHGSLETVSLADLDKMIALNFKTAFNLVKALLPKYQAAGGGKLIFIGAQAAMNAHSASHNIAYALSKQMLYGFSEMINAGEHKQHISSHILLPGTLDTEQNRAAMPNADFSKWTRTETIAETIREIVEGREMRSVVEV